MSGSLTIACHKLKRNFICIENNEDYFNKSVECLKVENLKKRLF